MNRFVSAHTVLGRFLADWIGMSALVFILMMVVIAIAAPWIAPFDPDRQDLAHLLLPFGTPGHLLGTDEFGRDQLSRIIFGARVSLSAAAIAVLTAAFIGVPFGTIAGYLGSRVDVVANWLNDALMSVPALVLALTIIAVLGRGMVNAMIAIGIVFAPRFFRLARATTSELRHETFVEASVSIGCSTPRIILRHVLPNALSPIIVQLALTSGSALIAEASLSFLGVGVAPPTASWGSMVGYAYNQITRAPYLAYAPGLCIMMSVLAFMLVGDGVRRALGTKRTTGLDGAS